MRRRLIEIGRGDRAVDRTIHHMTRLARRDATDPVTRGLLATLRRQAADSSDLAVTREAYRWMLDHVPYVADPEDREQVTAPKYILGLDRDGGDCDDMATAYASLMLAAGIPVWFKVIAWRGRAFTHVYNLVELRQLGIVIPVDCVLALQSRKGGYGDEKVPVIREKVYPI